MAKINIKIPTIPYVRPPREIYEFTPIGSFEYVNDIVKEIIEKGKTEVIRVNETGSRKSTKTES